jgi:hypothetical protein
MANVSLGIASNAWDRGALDSPDGEEQTHPFHIQAGMMSAKKRLSLLLVLRRPDALEASFKKEDGKQFSQR